MASRRSARISALEKRARVQPSSSSPPATSRKRGCKRKSLLSVFTRSLANLHHQGGTNSHNYGSADQPHESDHFSSVPQMPPKQTLKLFLDVLQRRDRNEIFAQPVNGEEVQGYYDIVKEPMDFGTMRAKLHEGLYTSLNQFERDVFLISSNAMKFNASNTVYYTEARAIGELARQLFHALRKEPGNFQLEATRMRRRREQSQASNLHAWVCKSSSQNGNFMKRKAQMFCSPSLSNAYIGHSSNGALTSGLIDDGYLSSCQIDKRTTYMHQTIHSENESVVSAVKNGPKSLEQVSRAETQYSDCLVRFVDDLGPTAQAVAQHKSSFDTPKSPSLTPFVCLAPEPSFMNGGIGDILLNTSAAYKGKGVCADRVPNNYDSPALSPNVPDNGITNHNLAVYEGGNANSVSRSSQNMDMLIATLKQISDIQNRHNYAPSGSYYPLTGNKDLPRNPPPKKIGQGAYFTWLLNCPEPTNATTQRHPIGEGSNVGPHYPGQAMQLARSKPPNGGGRHMFDMKFSGKTGWPLRAYGKGECSPAPHLQPMGLSLPNAKTCQPMGWKMLNGEGSSSSGRDRPYMGRAFEPVQLMPPEMLGFGISDLNEMANSTRAGQCRQLGPSSQSVLAFSNDRVTSVQPQSQVPLVNITNFIGGAHSRDYQQAQSSINVNTMIGLSWFSRLFRFCIFCFSSCIM